MMHAEQTRTRAPATLQPEPRRSQQQRPSRAPRGLLCAVALLLSLTGGTWLAGHLRVSAGSRSVLVLGDSILAGYRMARGSRFEDWLERELGSDWNAQNFAAAASQPADYYLQLAEAELLGVKPELVVIGLTPQKLIPEAEHGARLAEDGINLRWLPLSAEGRRFYHTLDPAQQHMAWVRKAGLLFGFYDALRVLWLEQVEWPVNRYQRARKSPEKRREWIAAHARDLDERWQHAEPELAALRARSSVEIADFKFLIGALRARHVNVVVVMPPGFHTGVYRTLSPLALQNLQEAYSETLALCSELGVAVLDFNRKPERERFLPAQWDDLQHLRAPECFRRMAQAVQRFVRSQLGAPV